MSILVKIGVFLVVILLIFSLFAPLLGPFFQERVVPRIGGQAGKMNGDSEAIASNILAQEQPTAADAMPEYEIMTALGYDAIPAILEPEFAGADAAKQWMAHDEQIIGLSINGDHRAYPIPMLSRHEIVNDIVGGEPVAITW